MKRLTCTFMVVHLIATWYSTCAAQSNWLWRIDSTSVINENQCYVWNSFWDGDLHENTWLLEENGYVRFYAYITYDSLGNIYGADTLDWDTFYLMKQFPQIGDTWQSWSGGPTWTSVVDTATMEVPAGTFFSYEFESHDQQSYELLGTGYAAESVGTIKFSYFGESAELTDFSIITGSGCFPLGVGNWWELSVVTPVEPSPNNSLPIKYTVLRAYPNPFNPSTTISFTLPVRSLVKLEVFDVSGRSVGAIHELPPQGQWLNPGAHSVLFDATGLASGVYLARLTVEMPGSGATPTAAVQKLVLMK